MKLNEGVFPITLGDETIELKATLNAVKAVSRQFNGISGASQAVLNMNLEAYVFIIRHGAGMDDAKARHLEQRVYRQGMLTKFTAPDGAEATLMGQLVDFVGALANGGKKMVPPADGEIDTGSNDAGNE